MVFRMLLTFITWCYVGCGSVKSFIICIVTDSTWSLFLGQLTSYLKNLTKGDAIIIETILILFIVKYQAEITNINESVTIFFQGR